MAPSAPCDLPRRASVVAAGPGHAARRPADRHRSRHGRGPGELHAPPGRQPAVRAGRDARARASSWSTTAATVVGSGTVDAAGSLAWRELDAGVYTVRTTVAGASPTRSPCRTSTDPAPEQSFYDGQTLDEGFGYITTRDGTTLSANVVLPAGRRPVPDRRRVLRLRPEQPGEHDDGASSTTTLGLRVRRREHPRHRLLRRLVPELRADPEPRRLRRDRDRRRAAVGEVPQGRHGRHLLPGHLAAVRRADPAAEPLRDHAAVGHRRHLPRHALPGRHPQHRLRGPVGGGARGAGGAVRPGLGAGRAWTRGDTVCAANQAVRLQNPDPLAADRGQPVLHDARSRPDQPEPLRRQDQRAGVPRRRLAGRADRRALPGDARRLHRRRRTSTRR